MFSSVSSDLTIAHCVKRTRELKKVLVVGNMIVGKLCCAPGGLSNHHHKAQLGNADEYPLSTVKISHLACIVQLSLRCGL